jgi:ABC-type glycerol-3-phosphate transport system substrate-binding protein
MKTISIALVSASVLALAACGGGNKNNSSNSANTSSATEQLNTDFAAAAPR